MSTASDHAPPVALADPVNSRPEQADEPDHKQSIADVEQVAGCEPTAVSRDASVVAADAAREVRAALKRAVEAAEQDGLATFDGDVLATVKKANNAAGKHLKTLTQLLRDKQQPHVTAEQVQGSDSSSSEDEEDLGEMDDDDDYVAPESDVSEDEYPRGMDASDDDDGAGRSAKRAKKDKKRKKKGGAKKDKPMRKKQARAERAASMENDSDDDKSADSE
jgi:hypothetical protein